MSRSTARTWIMWALAGVLWTAATRAQDSEVYALVQQGQQALQADQNADALAAFKKAIARPDFVNSNASLQYFAYYLGSFAASGVDDNALAHQYAVAATRFADADENTWLLRASIAGAAGNWDDAAQSFITVVKRWPKALSNSAHHGSMVGGTVRELGKQPATRSRKFELLNALFAANYKTLYDTEPSWFWLTLATDAIERKDLKRAREVAKRIDDSSTLVSMRIDKRFDELTASEPRAFDVRAAAERRARHLERVMKDEPKSLGPAVQYGYALYTLGRFEELLSLADGLIAKVAKAAKPEELYSDLDESLSWIHNHKASALRALGRWDESVNVMTAWQRSRRNHDDKVSQAINLGFFYNEMARPEDALKAVEGLQARDMSGYGRVQYEFVRFQAFQQLGKQRELEEQVAWLQEHQADDKEAAQTTLLESGDVDGAAAMMIARLRDPDERSIALSEIQIYVSVPLTERQQKLHAQREAMLARADVTAAIAEVGRREKQPIHSMEY
jgi:tetratricopeptide (TPR) repeat protein